LKQSWKVSKIDDNEKKIFFNGFLEDKVFFYCNFLTKSQKANQIFFLNLQEADLLDVIVHRSSA